LECKNCSLNIKGHLGFVVGKCSWCEDCRFRVYWRGWW